MDTSTPAPPRPYITNKQLRPMVQLFRRTRHLRDDLARAVMAIAGGCWDRYRFTDSREDFVADCVLFFCETPLKNCDPKGNCFGFLSTCAINFGRKLRAKEQKNSQRKGEYAAAVKHVMHRLRAQQDALHLHEELVPDEIDRV